MRQSSELSDYLASLDSNPLRVEAMSLFERCLAEGESGSFEAFVQEQLFEEPPQIELLRDVAEDLHQRLLSLREHHFDVRNQALRRLQNDYLVDFSPLYPPDALDRYHLADPDEAVLFLSQWQRLSIDDELRLRRLLEASTSMAAQLHGDVRMTEYLYALVTDWVMGLCAHAARHSWGDVPLSARGDDHIQ